MTVPDVSVIVIGYNDAAHLPAAVESVLAQTHKSLEVIVCDDHSTDETPELVAELVATDARVRSHRRAKNSGAPGAPLNDGLDRATGRYVMFLGSDDDLPPGAVAALLDEAVRSDADIVSGQLYRVLRAEGGKRVPWFPELHSQRRYGATIDELPAESQDTLTTNKMYRRGFLERIGARFPEGMLYEDVVFSAVTLAAARGIVQVPDEVYHWNVYPREERVSITNQRNTRKNLEDRLRALELAEEAFSASGDDVQNEFADKVLAHHLRFYLNDFLEADDEWCHEVLRMIRPRIERVPIAAFERRFLGDRLLYASAIEGDIEAVRWVLRGKLGGALAGRFFDTGEGRFWAPRDAASRPDSSALAKQLSSVPDSVKAPRSHAGLLYLHLIKRIEIDSRTVRVVGVSSDPLGMLREPGARLTVRLHRGGEQYESATAHAATPEGVRWVAELLLPALSPSSPATAFDLTVRTTSARGENNVSPLQADQFSAVDSVRRGNVSGSDWTLTPVAHGPARLAWPAQETRTTGRVIVIGDVSWQGRYHLGDEAMTEAALEQLRERGFEVTLVAGDPGTSRAQYGVDAVHSFGFVRERTRTDRVRRLAELEAGARGRGDLNAADAETVAAVKGADAVIVAGGGNLNSTGSQHIFERVALKRVAELAGVPMYVSSQTVGPLLVAEDLPMVQELVEYSSAFGARERATAALLRQIGAGRGNVVHTVDDAILLDPAGSPAELRHRLQLPERYVVGSFTFHAYSTGLAREEYYRDLARVVDGIVAAQDVDVVLMPHMGTLGVSEQMGKDNDQYGHDRVVSYSRSGRVRSLPLISAKELLTVTAEAEFTISTRYHPLVFGAAVGVPTIGLVTSYYSALRMRGALAGFGAESFAVPFEYWTPLLGKRVLQAMSERGAEFTEHRSRSGKTQRAYQASWWDAIALSVRTGQPLRMGDVPSVEAREWGDDRDSELLETARVAHEATNMYRMNNLVNVEDHAARIQQLEREQQRTTKSARREADALRHEVSKLQEDIAGLTHRVRPPGAGFRDRIRLQLRALRRR